MLTLTLEYGKSSVILLVKNLYIKIKKVQMASQSGLVWTVMQTFKLLLY